MIAQCTVISGDRCVHECRGPVPRSYEATASGLCRAHNPSRLAGWFKLAVALQLEQLSQSVSNWSAPVWTPGGGHSLIPARFWLRETSKRCEVYI